MRIAIFSVGPVFPDHVHGGSQKILREVAVYLGSVGHKVKILCTRRPDNDTCFQLARNVDVLPILRLKQTYPEPYYTAPYNIAHLINEVGRNAENSDVFYIHDAELPFHDISPRTPTVVSFRDFVYPDTLVGAFGFRRDELILSCDYVAKCVRDAFMPILPSVMSRAHVVHNGVNLSHFRPKRHTSSSKLDYILRGIPSADYTLLYPHRPDKKKGIYEAILIAAEVRRRLSPKGQTLRLLIPQWLDSAVATDSSHEYQTVYNSIQSFAEKHGVAQCVHLHDWVPHSEMPNYLSLGDATLSVGNFVEAFGNVHLESIACGTNAVVSRVAAHACNLPDSIVKRVDFGDVAGAADAVLKSFTEVFDVTAARNYLDSNFSYHQMLRRYEQILTSATIRSPLTLSYLDPLDSSSWVRLAAWARIDGQGVYNDYAYSRFTQSRQIRLALSSEKSIKVLELMNAGYSLEEIAQAIQNGILIQLNRESVHIGDS
jgi:glycosyltransferase involved in cell wall biosynthesis